MRVDPAMCLRRAELTIDQHGGGLPREALVQGLRVGTQFHRKRSDDDLPVGTSHLGGLPDLPPSTDWPEWDGYSEEDFVTTRGSRIARGCKPSALSFLGQLNLAEIPDGTGLLPERGWLWFFYDSEQQPWGFDPKHRGGARVLYFDGEPGALRRTQPPALVNSYHVTTLVPELAATLPRWSKQLELKIAESLSDSYWELSEEHIAGKEPHHRLLGWPKQVQGEMDVECQLVTHGIYCGDSKGYRSAEAKLLRAGAKDWVMLLQLDTDEDGPGWMWGDSGCLYFWIRRQDLAERRFEKGWTVLQCY